MLVLVAMSIGFSYFISECSESEQTVSHFVMTPPQFQPCVMQPIVPTQLPQYITFDYGSPPPYFDDPPPPYSSPPPSYHSDL